MRHRAVLHANRGFRWEEPFQQTDRSSVDILETVTERGPERPVRCSEREADVFEKPDLIFARIVADPQKVVSNPRPGETAFPAHPHILLLFVNAETEHISMSASR